jgi:hypothetical protein
VEREGYVRRGLADRVEAVDAQLRALDGTPTETPADEAVDASASEPAPAEELEPAPTPDAGPDAGPGPEPEREAEPRKTTRKAR